MKEKHQSVQVGILVDGINIGAELGILLSEPHAIDRKKVTEALEKILPGKVGNYYESLAKSIATRMQAAYQLNQFIELGGKGTYHVYAPVNYPGCIAGKESESKNFTIEEGIRYLSTHFEIPTLAGDEHIVPPCGIGCLCAVHCNF